MLSAFSPTFKGFSKADPQCNAAICPCISEFQGEDHSACTSMYFCQQICISMLLVSEQLQRLWHPKVILIFHRYCYSKGTKRNTHCTLFLRPHKPSPSIIGSHITAVFPCLSQSAWPFNWCLHFFFPGWLLSTSDIIIQPSFYHFPFSSQVITLLLSL